MFKLTDTFPINETLPVCLYAVVICMENIQTSYTDLFHQYRHLEIRVAMLRIQGRIILNPFVFRWQEESSL